MKIFVYKDGLIDKYTYFNTHLIRTELIVGALTNATHILFPVLYEVIFEYSDQERIKIAITQEEVSILKKTFFSLYNYAKENNLKLIVFYYRDPSAPLPLDYNYVQVFRTSMYRSITGNIENALPAFIDDKIKIASKCLGHNSFYGKAISKEDTPVIAFMGQSAPLVLPWKTNVKMILNKVSDSFNLPFKFNLFLNRGYLARRAALKRLIASDNVHVKYFISSWVEKHDNEYDYYNRYYQSVCDSPYQLCAAGFGNYSFRFYEVLALGRIPVLVDTDCKLPFEDVVTWENHIIRICERDVNRVDQILLDFHASITNEEFESMQLLNKELFNTMFTRDGFMKNFHLALN